jgi:Mrp family chromosome partitioning ATPase
VGFREATQEIVVSETARLCVIPCGRSVQNPAALLNTRVQSLLRVLREEYDVIVVDTPPINVVGDAAVIGAQSDGVIMVARGAVTGVQALAFATGELRRVAAPVIGTVPNETSAAMPITTTLTSTTQEEGSMLSTPGERSGLISVGRVCVCRPCAADPWTSATGYPPGIRNDEPLYE